MSGHLVFAATLISGLIIQPLDRRALLHGVSRASAAAAAVAILPPVIAEEQFVAKRARDATELKGSGGLSSYNELKLTNALKELAGAPVAAEIKPSVDVISSALPLITQNKVPDGAKISQASAALANLVLTEDLQTQAASLVKKSADIRAAIVKADANAAAIAATAFVDELTDFCYSYEGAEKPLAELRMGAPPVFDAERKKIDLPVSGRTL